jgi:hypothetical protein
MARVAPVQKKSPPGEKAERANRRPVPRGLGLRSVPRALPRLLTAKACRVNGGQQAAESPRREIPAAQSRRRPVVESYATRDEVAARHAMLERAGYTVLVTVYETLPERWVRPAPASPAKHWLGHHKRARFPAPPHRQGRPVIKARSAG